MKRDLQIIFGLLALTVAAFSGVGRCEFVDFDDGGYITHNPNVVGGLSGANFRWAWTTFYQGNYLPLTWLSFMANVSLFGTGPQSFHWCNLAFHAANAVLVYLVFRMATGAVWRSAVAAALFSVHPLRVESVVWVVERKDVLTGFFSLLALLAYIQFTRALKARWYVLALVLFAAALLAKQTLMTFPFLLLLLDYWPLGRWDKGPAALYSAATLKRTWLQLLLEKLPLLLMGVVIGIVTLKAQTSTHSVASLDNVPLSERLKNAPVSYARYLGKMFWFRDLAAFYPRHNWSGIQVAGAYLLLVGITVFALLKWRSSPWLIIGWLWFLGMLVPMIGLMQFADQSMADRFTYIAGLGFVVMLVWSVPATWCQRMPMLAAVLTLAMLALLSFFTFVQTSYWRDSVTLFTHDIAVAGGSVLAENNLANALAEKGLEAAAFSHYQAAVQLDPYNNLAQNNLAIALMKRGEYAQAVPHCILSLRLNPDYAKAHATLAALLNTAARFNEAESESRRAIALNPEEADGYNNLGFALFRLGQLREANDQFKRALSYRPNFPSAQKNLQLVQRAARESAKATAQGTPIPAKAP